MASANNPIADSTELAALHSPSDINTGPGGMKRISGSPCPAAPSPLQNAAHPFARIMLGIQNYCSNIISPTVVWKGDDDGKKLGPSENEVMLRVEIAKSTEVKIMTLFSFIFTFLALLGTVSHFLDSYLSCIILSDFNLFLR